MIQVFALVLYIGVGDDRQKIEETLYFDSVLQCNAKAQEVAKRWGHWRLQDQATSYCVPESVPEGTMIHTIK